jgi:hypothetical protein
MSSPAMVTEAMLQEILDYIDVAQARLDARQFVELTELNEKVDTLCAQVRDMSLDDAREYAPELDHLLERLTLLQTTMTQAQKELTQEATKMDTLRKATKQYKPPAGDV